MKETQRTRIGVVIVDDHPIVLAGLWRILERGGATEVLGEAHDGRTLLQLVGTLCPDVALIDLSMPALNGIDATLAIRARHPATRVLILSMRGTQATVMDAIEAGAMGYLLKDAAEDELERAVIATVQRKAYFSSAVATLLTERLSEHGPHQARLSPKTSADNKVNAEKRFYFSSLRAGLRIAPQLDFMQTGVPK